MVAAWGGQVQLGCLWVQCGVGQETGEPEGWMPESGVQGPERLEKVSNINLATR